MTIGMISVGHPRVVRPAQRRPSTARARLKRSGAADGRELRRRARRAAGGGAAAARLRLALPRGAAGAGAAGACGARSARS